MGLLFQNIPLSEKFSLRENSGGKNLASIISTPDLKALGTDDPKKLGWIRYSTAIFLGSFLLFQVQPIVASYILPWFGGGASVWTLCMLFFQIFLLGGYTYAHLLTKYLSQKKQVIFHLFFLACSFIALPITPAETWKPIDSHNPELRIVLLLFFTIGGPFLLVSSTGPLLQRWFASERSDKSIYRLFALSNFACLLALLTYPFLVEPFLGLDVQIKSWSVGYILYAIAVGWCAARVYRQADPSEPAEELVHQPETEPGSIFLWLALSACGVIVLLASTNELTQNIFPVPFLWILPLSLYLVTFILCFESERWYVRGFWITIFCLSFFPAVFVLHIGKLDGLISQIALYSIVLFAACMICHGELARLKPSPKYLTFFYLMIALGGALGSIFVNLAAPNLFNRYWEYPLGLFGVYLLAGICSFREPVNLKPPVKNRRPTKLLWRTGGVGFVFLLGLSMYIFESNDIANNRNLWSPAYYRGKESSWGRGTLFNGWPNHTWRTGNGPGTQNIADSLF